MSSAPRIAGLYVLADDDPRWSLGPVAQAAAALEGGARIVQLRAKRSTDGEVLRMGRAIASKARARGALFFVNDRFDLALAAGADGVHLGQDDLPPDAIPTAARERLLVGRSTHTAAQARAAAREPIDYMAYGPLFGTTSKESPLEARGLAGLAEVVAIAAPLPVAAIGGITALRCRDALDAGAAALCVIGAVAGARDPVDAARKLSRAINEGGAA